jgi:hypothetical protein
MRVIAEFVMRGRSYAIGASVLSASLPLLNWLSTAIVSLVVLRQGAAEGAMVLLWTLLPLGVALYLFGDPTAMISLFGTVGLALILRATTSWELTLAAAVVLSAVGSLVFEFTASEVLLVIVDMYMEYSKQVSMELSYEAARKSVFGFFAMGQAYAMLALLILARWWQSVLYNPGGFQKEFHQLRLTGRLSTGLVVLLMVCVGLSDLLGRWIPLLTVPLIVAGLGFVHWFTKEKKMSSNWLVAFYFLLLLFSQFIYPLIASLALMDSYLDMRKRIQKTEV